MINYIGKTNVYNEVLEHVSYPDVPKCKDCSYKKFKGMEVLTFTVPGSDDDTILVIKCVRSNYGLRITVTDFDTDEFLSSEFYKK